jgi:hypothetical protein
LLLIGDRVHGHYFSVGPDRQLYCDGPL